jgi:hypothetical protein
MPLPCPLKSSDDFNNKLNHLQMYNIAEAYKELFSVCLNMTTFRTIAVFKSFDKENHSNITCRYVRDLSL